MVEITEQPTNAYRVLLTRARQGMVIVVPLGDRDDPTRNPDFYDPTFSYLTEVGFNVIQSQRRFVDKKTRCVFKNRYRPVAYIFIYTAKSEIQLGRS